MISGFQEEGESDKEEMEVIERKREEERDKEREEGVNGERTRKNTI